MAKYRYVNTKFWTDGYVSTLDPTERLIFLYLLTNPSTSICGIYEITLRRVAFDTGIDQSVITIILNRLEKDGKVMYRQDWVAIKNFIKHQTVNPKIQAGISYELVGKPKELIDFIEWEEKVPRERRIRKKLPITVKRKVMEMGGHRCASCGEMEADKLEIDHIIPLVVGGSDKPENLQILCRSCNGKKNADLRWNKDGSASYSTPKKMGGLSHSNTNSNTNSKKNTPAAKAAAAPKKKVDKNDDQSQSFEEYLELMRASPQKHIKLIGEYADQIKPEFTTVGQWRVFTKRNLRAANDLSVYNQDQIEKAFECLEKDLKSDRNRSGFITRWTLETLLGYVVKK